MVNVILTATSAARPGLAASLHLLARVPELVPPVPTDVRYAPQGLFAGKAVLGLGITNVTVRYNEPVDVDTIPTFTLVGPSGATLLLPTGVATATTANAFDATPTLATSVTAAAGAVGRCGATTVAGKTLWATVA